MSDENLKELVTAWLDGDSELISRFYSELSLSKSLIPVIRVPLLATLTILVFRNLRRLPENRLRLYQMFIDLLLGGWNLAKGLQRSPRYTSTVKGVVLTRLAGLTHAKRENECGDVDLTTALRQVAPKLVGKLQDLTSELVEDGLLLPTGRSTYTFPHLSFEEYLAAKDAIDPSRQEEQRIVKAFLRGDDWYQEVATFLVCMATNPLTMRAWIVKLAKGFRIEGAMSEGEKRAAYLIGRLSDAFPECKAGLH